MQPGDSVAVVGCGHLGLWAVQAAKLAGAARIIAVEPLADRRALAGELGATDLVDPSLQDAVAAVKSATAGRGADVVIEAAGAPAAQRLALEISRRAGTVVYSGVDHGAAEVTLPQIPLAVQSRQLVSTQNGNVRMRRDLPRYIGLLERGLLDAAADHHLPYPLEEINLALKNSEAKDDLSGVIVF